MAESYLSVSSSSGRMSHVSTLVEPKAQLHHEIYTTVTDVRQHKFIWSLTCNCTLKVKHLTRLLDCFIAQSIAVVVQMASGKAKGNKTVSSKWEGAKWQDGKWQQLARAKYAVVWCIFTMSTTGAKCTSGFTFGTELIRFTLTWAIRIRGR